METKEPPQSPELSAPPETSLSREAKVNMLTDYFDETRRISQMFPPPNATFHSPEQFNHVATHTVTMPIKGRIGTVTISPPREQEDMYVNHITVPPPLISRLKRVSLINGCTLLDSIDITNFSWTLYNKYVHLAQGQIPLPYIPITSRDCLQIRFELLEDMGGEGGAGGAEGASDFSCNVKYRLYRRISGEGAILTINNQFLYGIQKGGVNTFLNGMCLALYVNMGKNRLADATSSVKLLFNNNEIHISNTLLKIFEEFYGWNTIPLSPQNRPSEVINLDKVENFVIQMELPEKASLHAICAEIISSNDSSSCNSNVPSAPCAHDTSLSGFVL